MTARLATDDPVLRSFADDVGSEGPVTIVGNRTRWDVGGTVDPSAREMSAPAGIVDYVPEEMTVRVLAGTTVADLHDALACPLPVLVIAHILGVPTDDIAQFKAWSDEQLAAANASDAEASRAPREAMNAYLLAQLDERRSTLSEAGIDPDTAGPEVLGDTIPDDVIGGILLAEVDGRRLGDDERLVMLNQLLVGGNETTTSLITNLFWRLLERPELYEELRDRPDLDAVAVEESLGG